MIAVTFPGSKLERAREFETALDAEPLPYPLELVSSTEAAPGGEL
jgi:hypothetical protein